MTQFLLILFLLLMTGCQSQFGPVPKTTAKPPPMPPAMSAILQPTQCYSNWNAVQRRWMWICPTNPPEPNPTKLITWKWPAITNFPEANNPTFALETSSNLLGKAWTRLLTTNGYSASVPSTNSQGYFRVVLCNTRT